MRDSNFFVSRVILKYRLAAVLMFLALSGMAQNVMMQGWWWNYPATVGFKTWGQNFLSYVPDISEAGFNYIWLPPLSRPSTHPSTGYDVKDYYDLGGGPLGATDFGTRQDIVNLTTMLKKYGVHPMADMIYNQRTGGAWETNPAVKEWITTFNQTSINNGDNPYPSDRYRVILPVGGSTGIDTGILYFKIRSASLSTTYQCYNYDFQVSSNKVPVAVDSTLDTWEFEPNGGGDCGDTDNFYNFSYNKYATVDGPACYGETCGIDEFRLHLDTTMYNPAGDTLYITVTNPAGSGASGWSDHYIYDIWDKKADSSVLSQAIYQTSTDFTHMPSGRGAMNWRNFKPDGNPTNLNGDWDSMLFFYDIDQYVASTISTIGAWQEWMFDSIGIEGMRMDAVKNYTYVFAAQMLDSLYFHGHRPGIVVGEFYDGYAPDLTGYIANVKSNMAPEDSIQMSLFDFALRFPLQDACNLNIDVRSLFTSGYVDAGGGSPANTVTWVNNHDFRTPDQYISANPELAYAYIITNPMIGTPCVFLQDYFASNFLKGRIKGLIHASRKYTFGSDHRDYLNTIGSQFNTNVTSGYGYTQNTTVTQFHNPVTNRVAIVAINFSHDTLDMYQQINTAYAAIGDTFTDIFGISPTATTIINSNSEIHINLPPRSFTMYVQGADLVDSIVSMGDTFPIFATQVVNIPPKQQGSISVFPNPFTQNVNMRVQDVVADYLQVNMYDLSGRLVYSGKFGNPENGTVTFTPPVTAAGIYLLKVTANDQSTYYKLARN